MIQCVSIVCLKSMYKTILNRMHTSIFNRKKNSDIVLLLKAVQQGMIYMIPLLLAGSVALALLSIPLPAYRNFMDRIFGHSWENFFLLVRNGTNGFFSVFLVLSISYSYINLYNRLYETKLSPFTASITALGSFIAVQGLSTPDFFLARLGNLGLFTALVSTVTASVIFCRLASFHLIKPYSAFIGGDLSLGYAIGTIFPMVSTIVLFALFNQILHVLFGISDLQGFISLLLYKLFAGMHNLFAAGGLYVLFVHLFWFVGIHGGSMLDSVLQNVLIPVGNGLGAGIFTETFFNAFVLMGGCGSTICLLLAVCIVGKDKNQRRIAHLAFFPSVFNINELVIFGLPVVYNPVFFIPFIIVPLLCSVTSSVAISLRFVPTIFLSGFAATGSVRGCILQLFNVLIGTLCYIPFVRLSDTITGQKSESDIKNLYTVFRQFEEKGIPSSLLNRYDNCGTVARALASELKNDLVRKKISVFYQLQVDYSGNLFGVETLLRWNRGGGSYLYPPLVIALAEEAGFIDDLGYYIFDRACADMECLVAMGIHGIVNSVNIIPPQLENPDFITRVTDIIDRHHIPHDMIEIEITEQLALTENSCVIQQLKKLEGSNISLAMDDFGMGHTSLLYLLKYKFDTVKLDGSLVKDLPDSRTSKDIISAIVTLGDQLAYSVIAEYVETVKQKEVLHSLGCDKYQGYLYGEAMPFDELVNYCRVIDRPRTI